MFESFDYGDRYVMYRALLHAIRSNLGYGFLNNDQGHPAYRLGPNDEYSDGGMGDSPEENALFKMMQELSASLKPSGEIREDDMIVTWADFCHLAIDGYEKATR